MSKKNTAQSEQRMVMGLWVVVERGVEKLKGPIDVKVLKCEQMVLAVKRCISSHSPRR